MSNVHVISVRPSTFAPTAVGHNRGITDGPRDGTGGQACSAIRYRSIGKRTAAFMENSDSLTATLRQTYLNYFSDTSFDFESASRFAVLDESWRAYFERHREHESHVERMLAQAVSLFGPEARDALGYLGNSGAGMIDRMKREVAAYQAEADGDRASLAHMEFRLDGGVWKYLAGPAHEESEEYRQKLSQLVGVCDKLTEEMQDGVYTSLAQLAKTKTRRFVAVYRGKKPPRPRQIAPVFRAAAPQPIAALRAELEALDNALRTDDPLLFDCLHPAASSDNIAALARAIGAPSLPDELAEWFRWHDGETPTRDQSQYVYGNAPRLWNGTNWTMLSAQAAAAAWKSMKRLAAGDLEQPWSIAWIPLFERASGDYTVFDASPAGYGTIRIWWHDDTTDVAARDLPHFVRELRDTQ